VGFASFGVPLETSDEHLQVWLERPAKWRIDRDDRIDVSDGVHRWTGVNGHVTETDQGTPDLDSTELGMLIAPGRSLFGALEFDEPVEDEVAGRGCLKVAARAASRTAHRVDMSLGLRLGGIDHTIWFDAATGMILRHVGELDEQPCSVSEFSGIVIDAPIAESIFTFTPPSGTTVARRIDQLIGMAEQSGVDLSDVDRTDERAVLGAMHTTMHPHRATPETLKSARRSKHIATGPPPDDVDAARQAIEFAYAHHNQVGEDGATMVHIHGGKNLAEPLKQAAMRIPGSDPSSAQIVVDNVLFLRPDEAVVWFGVEVGGQRFGMVDGREGRAVLVDGNWMVEHATIIDLLGFAGVVIPPSDDESGKT